MALPNSGPMSLAMIRNEFGGGNPVSLSQYYRGGGRVPNTPANAAVPTAGPIRLSNFYGATAYTPPTVSVGQTGGSVFQAEPAPATATVNATLTASGSGGTGSFSWQWRSSPGGAVISTAAALGVSASVPKNTTANVTRYLDWTDGVSSGSLSPSASLNYQTDL